MYLSLDYTDKKAYYFSNPETWSLWALIDLHDYLMYFLINVLIVVVVFTCMCLFYQQAFFKVKSDLLKKSLLFKYCQKKLFSFNHAPLLEFFWTIMPTIMLIFMGWPSFRVLYSMEQLIDPIHTIIITGNQWYRTYNYSDFDVVSDLIKQLDSNGYIDLTLEKVYNFSIKSKKVFLQALSSYLRKYEEAKIIYDCVILSDEDLPIGYPRLLSTDQVLVLPAFVSVRLLMTSSDVIHSWALPSHGVKMDAIPGRINQVNFLAHTSGTFWGQCSELCGVNHGFMPIEVRIMQLVDYSTYIALNISYRQDFFMPIVEKFIKAYVLREQISKVDQDSESFKNFYIYDKEEIINYEFKDDNLDEFTRDLKVDQDSESFKNFYIYDKEEIIDFNEDVFTCSLDVFVNDLDLKIEQLSKQISTFDDFPGSFEALLIEVHCEATIENSKNFHIYDKEEIFSNVVITPDIFYITRIKDTVST